MEKSGPGTGAAPLNRCYSAAAVGNFHPTRLPTFATLKPPASAICAPMLG